MNPIALEKLRHWMQQKGFERFLLQNPENFAWLSGGDNTVVINRPVATLEVTPHQVRLHTSRIEAQRLAMEEVPGIEVVQFPWYAQTPPSGPSDAEHDLGPLRWVLSPAEQTLYRALAQDASQALSQAMRQAQPNWSEYELAGAIAHGLYAKGIQPVVLLVAGEERMFKHRHPIPKHQPLGRLFLGVLCGRRHGLIANVSRLKSFGHPQAQFINQQVLQVEAAALNASRPGQTLGQVFEAMQQAYNQIGQPEAINDHHQGGLTAYRPREVLVAPQHPLVLQTGMALAYNPSLPGGKAEDTFLLSEHGLENLTMDPQWPSLEVAGRLRPAVLEE